MSTSTPDDQIKPAYREIMGALARGIDEVLNGSRAEGEPKTTGFVLMVFPLGAAEGGRFNYISNGNREDVVTLMREMIARFEGQSELRGQA